MLFCRQHQRSHNYRTRRMVWTTTQPLFASQTYDMSRLWLVAVLLAAAAPPAIVWLRRHQWQFTTRTVLIVVSLVSVLLAWLSPVFGKLLLYWQDAYDVLAGCPCDVPVLVAICSTIATWAACRQRNVRSASATDLSVPGADADAATPPSNPHRVPH